MALTLTLVGALCATCAIGGGALIIGMIREQPDGGKPGPTRTAAAGTLRPPPSGAENKALVVRATGDKCRLFVAYPGTSQVIFDGPLHKGEVGQYDAPRLEAVVSEAADCDVWINGEEQPAGQPGQRMNHRITKALQPR